jgi:hypothetical protein
MNEKRMRIIALEQDLNTEKDSNDIKSFITRDNYEEETIMKKLRKLKRLKNLYAMYRII